jgi:DNA-binding response OmpR family regulator
MMATTMAWQEPSLARGAEFGSTPVAPAAPPRRLPAAARLVLFVGARADAELAAVLLQVGIRCLWVRAPGAALEAARQARFDALVIGPRVLGAQAAALLARLRAAFGCPLLLWAQGGDEVDEIMALEQGADAYLGPPLAPRRLRAHLLALMRLRPAPVSPMPASLVAWRVDRVRNRLHDAAHEPVALTQAQAALLQALLDADGRVVPRAQLADALQPSHGHALQTRSIDVYMHRLRGRLREADARGFEIEAVRGRGYLLRPA